MRDGSMSVATTCPVGPTISAIRCATEPPPAPTSQHLMPCRMGAARRSAVMGSKKDSSVLSCVSATGALLSKAYRWSVWVSDMTLLPPKVCHGGDRVRGGRVGPQGVARPVQHDAAVVHHG